MSLHVKKGDTVAVIAGKDKKKTGKVLAVNPSEGTVIVDGVNIITKHNKPRSANQPGGIVKENGKIDASNVMVVCPACGKATRIAAGEADGKKIRLCKKCGASLDAKKAEKKVRKTAKAAATEEVAVEEKKAPKKSTKKSETATEKKPAAKKTTKKTTESSEK